MLSSALSGGWSHGRFKKLAQPLQNSWCRRIAVILTIVVCTSIYYLALLQWGTFSPIAVVWGTAPYFPPTQYSTLTPPRERVVLTLTSVPHRLPLIAETLRSLVAQSHPADAIYLNVPKRNERLGVSYTIPDDVLKIEGVTIVECEDVGPITKLVPALELEKDNSTIIITVDDDQIYPTTMVSHLLRYARRDPSAAFSTCGWSFMFLTDNDVHSIYAPFNWMRGEGRYVDTLQACCAIAYRRGFFPDVKLLANGPKECYTIDDVWAAGYLAILSKVPRILTANDVTDKKPPSWKAKRDKNEFSLSSINDGERRHIKCIKAIERTYGPWPTVAKFKAGVNVLQASTSTSLVPARRN